MLMYNRVTELKKNTGGLCADWSAHTKLSKMYKLHIIWVTCVVITWQRQALCEQEGSVFGEEASDQDTIYILFLSLMEGTLKLFYYPYLNVCNIGKLNMFDNTNLKSNKISKIILSLCTPVSGQVWLLLLSPLLPCWLQGKSHSMFCLAASAHQQHYLEGMFNKKGKFIFQVGCVNWLLGVPPVPLGTQTLGPLRVTQRQIWYAAQRYCPVGSEQIPACTPTVVKRPSEINKIGEGLAWSCWNRLVTWVWNSPKIRTHL